jgi:hypothetical protein
LVNQSIGSRKWFSCCCDNMQDVINIFISFKVSYNYTEELRQLFRDQVPHYYDSCEAADWWVLLQLTLDARVINLYLAYFISTTLINMAGVNGPAWTKFIAWKAKFLWTRGVYTELTPVQWVTNSWRKETGHGEDQGVGTCDKTDDVFADMM